MDRNENPNCLSDAALARSTTAADRLRATRMDAATRIDVLEDEPHLDSATKGIKKRLRLWLGDDTISGADVRALQEACGGDLSQVERLSADQARDLLAIARSKRSVARSVSVHADSDDVGDALDVDQARTDYLTRMHALGR